MFNFPIFLEFDSFPRWNYTCGLVPYLSVLTHREHMWCHTQPRGGCDVMYYRSHKHHASPQADFLEKNFQFPLIFLEFDSFPRWNYTFGLVPYLSVLNFPWPPSWACDVTRNHMIVWHHACHAHCTQNNLLPTCWKKPSLPVINLSWKFVARITVKSCCIGLPTISFPMCYVMRRPWWGRSARWLHHAHIHCPSSLMDVQGYSTTNMAVRSKDVAE